MGVNVHGDGAGGVPGESPHDLGMRARAGGRGEVGVAKAVEAVVFGAQPSPRPSRRTRRPSS